MYLQHHIKHHADVECGWVPHAGKAQRQDGGFHVSRWWAKDNIQTKLFITFPNHAIIPNINKVVDKNTIIKSEVYQETSNSKSHWTGQWLLTDYMGRRLHWTQTSWDTDYMGHRQHRKTFGNIAFPYPASFQLTAQLVYPADNDPTTINPIILFFYYYSTFSSSFKPMAVLF